MDWHAEDASWTNRDFGILQYEKRRTVVLRKLHSDPTIIKDELQDKQEWEDWFYDGPCAEFAESGFYMVLCSRALPVFGTDDAPASYVSVTRDTWERLTRTFHIHREIRRPISRGVDYFTSHYEGGKGLESRIYFIARMSAALPGDLALSLTYIPSKDTTFAVVYGCKDEQMRDIERRVRDAGDKIKYPLLMIGLLAELERERLLTEVEQLVDLFTLRSDYFDGESNTIAADISNEKTQEYVALCFKSRSLIDRIKAVKHQLSKLVTEIDKFANNATPGKGEVHQPESKKGRRFKKPGNLMKKRVLDIIDEYDIKISECKMIVEDMSLATQTAFNQIARMDSDVNKKMTATNTLIAEETKTMTTMSIHLAEEARREGTQMKSIALLTMIYLPFSSVAAIFSMDMFDWNSGTGGPVVSKYIWVFAAFAIGLTGVTLFAWYFITFRYNPRAKTDASWDQGRLV